METAWVRIIARKYSVKFILENNVDSVNFPGECPWRRSIYLGKRP